MRAVAWVVALAACQEDPVPPMADQVAEWTWDLPVGLPEPAVPADNPMTAAKVELGRHLFYENRISVTGDSSCGTCHQQSKGFTDGQPTAMGATGEAHRRSAMGLTNVAYNTAFTWSNDLIRSLEDQALGPLFGTDPVELGLSDREQEVLDLLAEDDLYADLFAEAFPEDEDPFTLARLLQGIAAFERTLLIGDTNYDRYFSGDVTAMSDLAMEGLALFNSERLECYHCHGGFNLTDSATAADFPFDERFFHNNGLYNVDGEGAYPARDQGLIEVTLDARDMGAFRAPSLRNITLTAPYMHDGSLVDLDAVIDHYAAGGRLIPEGPDAGDGSESPLKSPFLVGFELTEHERDALHAFFDAITNEEALLDEAFSDPFGNVQ